MRVGLKPYSQADLPEKESKKPRLNGALPGNAALALEQNGACARSSPGPCCSRTGGPCSCSCSPGTAARSRVPWRFSPQRTCVFRNGANARVRESAAVQLRGLPIGEALLFTYAAPRWSRTREIGLSPTAGGGRGPAVLSAACCPTQTR